MQVALMAVIISSAKRGVHSEWDSALLVPILLFLRQMTTEHSHACYQNDKSILPYQVV